MADHDGDGHGHGDERPEYATERSTAPQSDYTTRDIAIGAVIAVVGVVVAFGIPLALA